jgi:hypothetical protein
MRSKVIFLSIVHENYHFPLRYFQYPKAKEILSFYATVKSVLDTNKPNFSSLGLRCSPYVRSAGLHPVLRLSMATQ